jgi:inner membrane transporter RhtA
VFCLLLAELADRLQLSTLEQAALEDVGVEGRLEVLERERVVEDADVALAEFGGFALAAAGRRGRAGRGRAAVAAAGGEEGGERTGATADRQELPPRPGSCQLLDVCHRSMPPGRLPAPVYGQATPGGSQSRHESSCSEFSTGQMENLMQLEGEARGRAGGATLLVLASIVSVQSGAALATGLFDPVGPAGAVFLRAGFGAIALLLFTRGAPLRTREWPHRDVWLLSVSVAAVNLAFYAALDRLPLGITVTLEFVGPLGVAVLGSRRPRDVLWVLLAAAGIILLSDGTGGEIDGLGVALALTAGFFWGAYIVLSARVGALAPGAGGATMAAVISAFLVAPLGIAQGGVDLLTVSTLATGAAIGVLSTALPYAFEMEALRRLPRAVFGVLMSLEPAVAAAIGFIALSQDLSTRELIAIALVVIASAGALRTAAAPIPRD